MSEYLEETGEVLEVSAEGILKVLLKRHSSCDKCGACGMGVKPELVLEIKNEVGAQKGDVVLLQIGPGQLYKAAFLVYTIPLIMLIVGFLIGQKVSLIAGANSSLAENLGIFSGFLFLAIAYLAIRWFDQRQKVGMKLQPQLIGIIEQEPQSSK